MWLDRFLLVALAFHFLLLISDTRAENQPTNAEIVTSRRLLAAAKGDDRSSRIQTRSMSKRNDKSGLNNHGGWDKNVEEQVRRMSSSSKQKNKVKHESKYWTIESVSSSSSSSSSENTDECTLLDQNYAKQSEDRDECTLLHRNYAKQSEDKDECTLLRERNTRLEKELHETTQRKAQLEKELRQTAEMRAQLEQELREKTEEHENAVELANKLAQENMELEQETEVVQNAILALRKEVWSIKQQLPRSCQSRNRNTSKFAAITKPESHYHHHNRYTASSNRNTGIPRQDVHDPERLTRALVLPALNATSSNRIIERQEMYFPRRPRSPTFHTDVFGSDILDNAGLSGTAPNQLPFKTLEFPTDVCSHSRTERTISTQVRNFYNHDHISGCGNIYSHETNERRPSSPIFQNVHDTTFLPLAANSDTFFKSPTTFDETLSPPLSTPNPTFFSKPGTYGRYNDNHNKNRHPPLPSFRRHFSNFGKIAPYNNNRHSGPISRSHYYNPAENFWNDKDHY